MIKTSILAIFSKYQIFIKNYFLELKERDAENINLKKYIMKLFYYHL